MKINLAEILGGIRQNIVRDLFIALLITSTIIAITFLRVYFEEPVYQSQTTFVMSPIGEIADERNLISVIANLDEGVKLTFVEILESRRIRSQALEATELEGVPGYTARAIVLPGSNVLQLTVNGPSPIKTAELADNIGALSIEYVDTLYPIYQFETLDTSPIPRAPISPNVFRDMTLAVILGLFVSIVTIFFLHTFDITLDQPEGESTAIPELEVPALVNESAVESTANAD